MMPWLIYVANVILGIGAAVIWTAQVIQRIPTTFREAVKNYLADFFALRGGGFFGKMIFC